jgi:hypothetical protein
VLLHPFALLLLAVAGAEGPPAVTFESLLHEMADRDALTRLPSPDYRQLQASSYNRESKRKGGPGWFADSDGTGFVREERNGGRKEWVLAEHAGPGCLTRIWTPYFHHDFGNRVGARVRVYLDGSATPVIDAHLIELLTRNDWPPGYGPCPKRQDDLDVPAPFARFTARAGDLYLPIPFARSMKVTLDERPFYFCIDWRAYAADTQVESFTRDALARATETLAATARALAGGGRRHAADAPPLHGGARDERGTPLVLPLGRGPAAVDRLTVEIAAAALAARPALLRELALTLEFDGETCAALPLGDLFASADALHPFRTFTQEVAADGAMTLRWVMPYRERAVVTLTNYGPVAVGARISAQRRDRPWDERSLHFHATWRPDDVVPGDRFEDWNFVEIEGAGLFVGDTLTVLNLTDGWWGEGDEKIYVDDSCERGFPDHFGTGSEDYYGWAGGVNPTRADQFDHPFLANVRVGSTDRDSTRGFNVLDRVRALDAIPFARRLVFDMEASPGVGQRNAWDRLAYSATTFWYARPGATSNRPALVRLAPPVPSLPELTLESERARAAAKR